MVSRLKLRNKRITLLVPAKINLLLSVLGREAGGYHSVVSLMQMVGLYDRLTVEVIPGGRGTRLEIIGYPIPRKENLVLKAVRLFRRTYGFSAGVRISLVKKIPLGAGLAGGSSDAAATLEALSRIGGRRIPRGELSLLSHGLGSDVPFFLNGPTAWVSGIGQYTQKVSSPKTHWVVLANPGFEVSTAWVYRRWDERNPVSIPDSDKIIKKLGLTSEGNGHKVSFRQRKILPLTGKSFVLWNDLEAITVGKFPVIERVKKRLKTLGAREAMMSGSGPTVFGLFKKQAPALRAAEKLRQEALGGGFSLEGQKSRRPIRPWGVWVARTLSRSPF